jgi:hypothetical protein
MYDSQFHMADGSKVFVSPKGKITTDPPLTSIVPFAYYGRKFLNLATQAMEK